MSSTDTWKRAVVIGAPDAASLNTIVLGGTSVVVPIELVPEDDPLHDDEIRMWSTSGHYDRTLKIRDAEVEPDHDSRLMHYRFEDVPFGVYRVAVCAAGEWHDFMHGLVVAPDGVYLGGKQLPVDRSTLAAAPPELSSDDADEITAPAPEREPLVYLSHGIPSEPMESERE
jgi:hypothetical protein